MNWEESLRFYAWVNGRCQIWTNIYKVFTKLIDNIIFVYVLFEFLNKVAGFSVNVSWVI